MVDRIALLVPELPTFPELEPYLRRIDGARWYTNFGPLVHDLETRLQSTLGRGQDGVHVVTTANGTLALELTLTSLGLATNARVLLPALTFAATATAVIRSGLTPFFADVDPASWTLTPSIARDVARRAPVSAVLAVSTFGSPQDSESWDRFIRETHIPVVIDAAGAFGNQSVGAAAPVIFSLHATKVLGCGEGGLVASRQIAFSERLRRQTNFGIDLKSGTVYDVGTNAKMSEYHAAVALAALDLWPDRHRRLTELHRLYTSTLARHCPSVDFQFRLLEGVYSVLPVRLPEGASAAAAVVALATAGVESRQWYCPTLDRHPAFCDCPVAGGLPVTAALNERLLALPFHTTLTVADIDRICETLARVLKDQSV